MAHVLLFGIAVAARAAVAMLHGEPAYADSYYYVNVARELASGQGFQVGYIWNFIDVGGTVPVAPTLPVPSNAHWMPLASIVQVPFIWLLGPSPLASTLPFWLIGALAAPLAYSIARDAALGRSSAITAGLLTAVPLGLTPFMAQPDNFGLFMTLAAATLWLASRGSRGDGRALVLGGLTTGLAMLSRNDGVLLLLPMGLATVVLIRRSETPSRALLAGATAAAVLLATLTPWLIRQLVTFGSFAPSAASGHMLWLTDYEQQFSVSDPPTLAGFLAAGVGPILESRIDGLISTLTILIVAPFAVVLAVFLGVGIWRHRRSPHFREFFVYAIALIGASALVFSVHAGRGFFLHSVGALLPHAYVLVAAGVAAVTAWVARRRVTWHAPRATRMFLAAAVAVSFLAAALQIHGTAGAWADSASPKRDMNDVLAALAPDERVMSADPGSLNYLYGLPGVLTPQDPLPVIENVARAYEIRWLLLESRAIVPALQPILLGAERPGWISEPLTTVEAIGGATAPRAALYALCFEPSDRRCDP
ncbi:MAG TPA: glycosyltransferase family 39 protein [Candidatus Limnocylindrales bacterium]|nr:glycosyltransferase family 39 protein [Candidatus Limnocylindrales bacterium]